MIVVDVNSIPPLRDGDKEMKLGEIFQFFLESEIIIYDSLFGQAPVKYDDNEFAIVDVSSKEGIKFLKEHEK